MASKVKMLIEGDTAGVYDVMVSDDKTGFTPIRIEVSGLEIDSNEKRVLIEASDGYSGGVFLDFAGANGMWHLANEIDSKPGVYDASVTISTLPAYFWIKTYSKGEADVIGDDEVTVLRAATTQVDFFDTERAVVPTGSLSFDTVRNVCRINEELVFDTVRKLKALKQNYFFAV